ncbi:hypothetical protein AB1K81_13225 [Ornithinibacillus sp. 179-J 7C1 HS]
MAILTNKTEKKTPPKTPIHLLYRNIKQSNYWYVNIHQPRSNQINQICKN